MFSALLMELSLVPDYLPNTARPGSGARKDLEGHPFLSMKGDGSMAEIFRDDSVFYVFDDAQLKSR